MEEEAAVAEEEAEAETTCLYDNVSSKSSL